MLQLFGNKSNIFVTPYGPFNSDTIKAMNNVGIQILSSALVNEEHGNASISHANGFSVFVSRAQYTVNNNNIDTTTTNSISAAKSAILLYSQSHKPGIVYHLPAMSLFYDDVSGKPPIKTPIEQILLETKNSIKEYGYSVIVFHPQDFVERDDQGKVIGNGVNLNEVNDLSYLIDSLVQQKIPIVHFSTLMKYINTNNSDIQLLMESNNGVTQFGYFENMTSIAPNKANIDKNNSVAQFGYFQNTGSDMLFEPPTSTTYSH